MIIFTYSLFVTTLLVILCIDRIIYNRRWYDPLYCFLFTMLIYVSPLSIRYILNLPIEYGITPYLYEIEDIFPYATIATTMAVIIFYISYIFSPKLKFKQSFLKQHKHNDVILRRIAIIVFCLGLLNLSILSQQFGGIKNVILMGYNVTEIFAQNPMISMSINMMFASSFLLLSAYSIARRKQNLFLSILTFAFCSIILTIMGRRSELVIFTGSYIIFYALSIKDIKFKQIIPIVIAGFIFLNILGLARNSDYDDIESFIEVSTQRIDGLEDNQDGGIFYTLIHGQFAIPYETLPILMKYHNNYLYGATITDMFTQWIPRSIYPDKDYGIAVWYYHEFYDPNAPSNEGRQFFFLSEGYLNFGIIGIFIWAILWGFFWKNIASLTEYKNLLFYFVFSIYTASMLILVPNYSTGLFTTIIKTYIIWFLLPYILYLIIINIKNTAGKHI